MPDEMNRALSSDGCVHQHRIGDVDVAVGAVIVDGDPGADRRHLVGGSLHGKDVGAFSVEARRSGEVEAGDHVGGNRIDHCHPSFGVIAHEQAPGSRFLCCARTDQCRCGKKREGEADVHSTSDMLAHYVQE